DRPPWLASHQFIFWTDHGIDSGRGQWRMEPAMKWVELSREPCSVARSVAVIGDRWTLLILRDCFLGVRRFEGFQERLGISRTIIADRLKVLTDEGVLEKAPYQERPVRHEYRLTQKGLDLYPVILAVVSWGD